MKIAKTFLSITMLIAAMAVWADGQSNEFTYQGSLKDGAVPANANYDFEFLLYSAASGGSQIGSTNARSNVAVAAGVFSVTLDFGAGFPGADRFLEIRVRAAAAPAFTTLTPRQKMNSAPYGIRSQTAGAADTAVTAATATNATQLGGVAASQFVQTTDPRLTDARPPTAGSTNYVQNTTTTQASSNFNISGNGTAAGTLSALIVNASSYNLAGSKILSIPGNQNLFAGIGAGQAWNGGIRNSFFGFNAGGSNESGGSNTMVGYLAGTNSTAGNNNSFFGAGSGQFTTGSDNSFFGKSAGDNNTTGTNNTAIGNSASVGSSGNNNTTIGANSGAGSQNASFATAIGAGSVATESDSVTLGRPADIVYIPGFLRLVQLGGAGATAVCRNNANTLGTCSSSLRYKTNIGGFNFGLNLIKRLRPITFDWKDGGMHDLGLGAEDVAAIEPLLVTYNSKGEVEGVKYDRIGVVLINAIKEQQAQIEALKKLVCVANKDADVCKEK